MESYDFLSLIKLRTDLFWQNCNEVLNADRRRACWREAQRSRKLSNLINTIIRNEFYLGDFYFFLTLFFLGSSLLLVYVFYMNTLIAS